MPSWGMRWLKSVAVLILLLVGPPVPWGAQVCLAQGLDDEIEALLAEERAEASRLLSMGRYGAALALVQVHLQDEPTDAAARNILALVRADQGKAQLALREAKRALGDAKASTSSVPSSRRDLIAACGRTLVAQHLTLGQVQEAFQVLSARDGRHGIHDPGINALDAWAWVQAHDQAGDLEAALASAQAGIGAPAGNWPHELARGLCHQYEGGLVGASRVLVEADRLAQGREASVLVALAGVYFESEQEVEAEGKRSVGLLLREALELCPGHQGALLAQADLHRLNRMRQSQSPGEILGKLLNLRPDSILGLVAAATSDLADGQLVRARRRMSRLEQLAPNRRDVRSLQAAMAWIEHRRADCNERLEALASEGPKDSRPERLVGSTLLQLYRFVESRPFLRRAVERDPSDYAAWSLLGLALANSGDEPAARVALENGKTAAKGRQDAKRHNLAMVLDRLDAETVDDRRGELTFAWMPDAAEVFETYLVPFYGEARQVFATRYGHTPGHTRIEVFRRFSDFSVRSVGFEGFPALGVCFGPVVTSVSPLAEIRGSFSWARTAWHEFSHVVHLGLSHNRCPRWITEGLATWEETERNPSWTRNMRRELLDSVGTGNLILVRDLNRAFRGPRILFGYYQGGLLCSMLIEEHGFAPMVGLLQAFDEGLDLDQAFERELGMTPEEVDVDFARYAGNLVAELAIEPRQNPRRLGRLRLSVGKELPADPADQEAWMDDWLTIAWGYWQQGSRVDAEAALRISSKAPLDSARALFLRAEMAVKAKDPEAAMELLLDGAAAGGREYRALMTLARLLERDGDVEEALLWYQEAELCFPGFDDPSFSAERSLAKLHEQAGRTVESMGAMDRWLAWNMGEYTLRVKSALWHHAGERHEQAVRLFEEANEVDPFRRDLHEAWGKSLLALKRFEEAEREFSMTLAVPVNLDPDHCIFLGNPGELRPGATLGTLPSAERKRLGGPEQWRLEPVTDLQRMELLLLQEECALAQGELERAAQLRKAADALVPNGK